MAERTAELAASEERFRLMVESVQDYAIFMLDPAGHVATWNTGAQHLKGYSAEEIIGKHFACFYPPEEADKPQRELAIAAKAGQYSEEGWRLRKDGSRFWASVTITALREPGGALRGFAKITRDMTERQAGRGGTARGRESLSGDLRVEHRLHSCLGPRLQLPLCQSGRHRPCRHDGGQGHRQEHTRRSGPYPRFHETVDGKSG